MGFSLRMQGFVSIRKFINIVRFAWLSHIGLFVTPWTIACKAPLSMEFSRQESWSGLPFPTPRDIPHPGIEPIFLACPSLAGGFFTTMPPGKPERAQDSVSEYIPGVQSTGFSTSLVDRFSALESFYSRLKSSEDLHVEFITKHQIGEKCSIFVVPIRGTAAVHQLSRKSKAKP